MRVCRIVLLIMVLVALALGSVSCDLFKATGGTGGGGGGAPAVPTGLSVGSPLPSSLQVTWNSSSGATSYQLYRDTTPSGTSAMLVYSSSGTAFTDSELASSSNYYYWVQATNSYGSSALPASPMGSGTTQAAQVGLAPSTPTGLAVSLAAPILTVSWNSSTNATSYLVYRATSSVGPFSLIANGDTYTQFVDIPAPSGGTFYYEVEATNASGSSGKSSASSGTQALGTNAFEPLMGLCMFATNDVANEGYYAYNSITGSSLSGTLDSTVTKWSGMTGGFVGVVFDYIDSNNYWLFFVYCTSPGKYSIYQKSGGVLTAKQSLIANSNIATYAGDSNDLKVTYSYASPNYYLNFYINGALVQTLSSSSAMLGSGSTGFVAGVSSSEDFPTKPVIDSFIQTQPVPFSGNMVVGPSGARASIQAMPPVKSGSIAPQPNRFPTPR